MTASSYGSSSLVIRVVYMSLLT